MFAWQRKRCGREGKISGPQGESKTKKKGKKIHSSGELISPSESSETRGQDAKCKKTGKGAL